MSPFCSTCHQQGLDAEVILANGGGSCPYAAHICDNYHINPKCSQCANNKTFINHVCDDVHCQEKLDDHYHPSILAALATGSKTMEEIFAFHKVAHSNEIIVDIETGLMKGVYMKTDTDPPRYAIQHPDLVHGFAAEFTPVKVGEGEDEEVMFRSNAQAARKRKLEVVPLARQVAFSDTQLKVVAHEHAAVLDERMDSMKTPVTKPYTEEEIKTAVDQFEVSLQGEVDALKAKRRKCFREEVEEGEILKPTNLLTQFETVAKEEGVEKDWKVIGGTMDDEEAAKFKAICRSCIQFIDYQTVTPPAAPLVCVETNPGPVVVVELWTYNDSGTMKYAIPFSTVQSFGMTSEKSLVHLLSPSRIEIAVRVDRPTTYVVQFFLKGAVLLPLATLLSDVVGHIVEIHLYEKTGFEKDMHPNWCHIMEVKPVQVLKRKAEDRCCEEMLVNGLCNSCNTDKPYKKVCIDTEIKTAVDIFEKELDQEVSKIKRRKCFREEGEIIQPTNLLKQFEAAAKEAGVEKDLKVIASGTIGSVEDDEDCIIITVAEFQAVIDITMKHMQAQTTATAEDITAVVNQIVPPAGPLVGVELNPGPMVTVHVLYKTEGEVTSYAIGTDGGIVSELLSPSRLHMAPGLPTGSYRAQFYRAEQIIPIRTPVVYVGSEISIQLYPKTDEMQDISPEWCRMIEIKRDTPLISCPICHKIHVIKIDDGYQCLSCEEDFPTPGTHFETKHRPICPKCQTPVKGGDYGITEMFYAPFYCAEGKEHQHDGNKLTGRLTCHNCNHFFMHYEYPHSCEFCNWKQSVPGSGYQGKCYESLKDVPAPDLVGVELNPGPSKFLGIFSHKGPIGRYGESHCLHAANCKLLIDAFGHKTGEIFKGVSFCYTTGNIFLWVTHDPTDVTANEGISLLSSDDTEWIEKHVKVFPDEIQSIRCDLESEWCDEDDEPSENCNCAEMGMRYCDVHTNYVKKPTKKISAKR